MRFLVTIFFLCILFELLQLSQARENVIDSSWRAEKGAWLASTLSAIRRATVFRGKWSLSSASSPHNIGVANPEVRSRLQVAGEKTKMPKSMSLAFNAILSGKSEWHHSPSSYTTGKQKTESSSNKITSLFSARQVPTPSLLSSPAIQINSTAVQSASPTPIPSVLFQDVVICKARNPVWNVAIRNAMGELLIAAYPGSLEKAETFARCIRDDVTTMKREEYLQFAVYNCVGTNACPINARTGVCSCTGRVLERCINVEYTRALTECRYGPGV